MSALASLLLAASCALLAWDVLRRRRTEAALRSREALYRLVLGRLPDSAVVLFDHDLRFLLAGGESLEGTGLARERLEGRTVREALPALAEHNLANEVVVVRDGAEALDYLHRRGRFKDRGPGEPAVILLDLEMPKVDGLEVLRAVKSDAELRRVPVVMLTSSREEQDLVDSYRLGVNAYVVKPVDFARFLEAVRRLGMFWAAVNEPPPGTLRRCEGR